MIHLFDFLRPSVPTRATGGYHDEYRFTLEDRRQFLQLITHKKETRKIFDRYLEWKGRIYTDKAMDTDDELDTVRAKERVRFIKDIQNDVNVFAREIDQDEKTKLDDREKAELENRPFKIFTSPIHHEVHE